MKYLKRFGLFGLAAMAVAAVSAPGSASATTLEITGSTQNQSVEFAMSLESGSSVVFKTTSGTIQNTCTASEMAGSTITPYTGTTVTAPLTTLSFGKCTGSVTVDKAGTLHFEHIKGTTDAKLISSGAEITVWSVPMNQYLNLKTGSGVTIGIVTGVQHDHAKVHVNAVVSFSFLLPSGTWEGDYIVTTPTGFGISQ
ncbi:MAG TPA: hypothetical protein VFZ29_06680 [Solirubrobacterales bacterium]